MAKIALGGWQHETNTFAPVKAGFDAFERTDEWPGLVRGEALFEAVAGVHLPITGALEYLRGQGHALRPLLWCSATPSAHVTEDAFERIASMLLEEVGAALPVDGVYLDLHGAMVCEHLEDGEGEILGRVRSLIGPDVPLVASLDLHANVTPAMTVHADALDIFRTYPHIDMGRTGARAARHLNAFAQSAERWQKALCKPDFLIPLNWGCTLIEPAKSLYAMLPTLIRDDVRAVSFACGFPLSDIAEVGPSVLAYAATPEAAETTAAALLDVLAQHEVDFNGRLYMPEEAVQRALAVVAERGGPVVLADTQDNPGGGGPGDTTGLLRALADAGASAVFGVLADAHAATQAHSAGVGRQIDLALGEQSGLLGHTPYEARFKVLALGDGRFTATGPMYKGAHMELGPMALLEVDDVRVLVASKAVQTADQSILRHLGVEPAEQDIIALKSSVHFRNDFQDFARAVMVVTAPGPVYADPSRLTFDNIRAGVRLTPRTAAVKRCL